MLRADTPDQLAAILDDVEAMLATMNGEASKNN